MKKIITGLALIISCSLFAQQKVVNNSPTVKTASGIVQGITEGDVAIFKGIPFAAPPVGEFRWRPPQPVTTWEGVRDAGKFGSNCAAAGWGGPPGSIQAGSSEDCLYLNLWTPSGAKKR